MTKFQFRKRPFTGLFLLYLLFLSSVLSQDFHPVISSVEFSGNDKTRNYIIEREIQHPVDVNLDSSLAKEDLYRLENLGLFSEITWQAIPLENGTAILEYRIIESMQRTPPVPVPIYEEDTGWSLGGAWVINNFRGRNQMLVLGGMVGGQNTYGINFLDPWIFGNHVSVYTDIGKKLYSHNFLEMDVEVNSFQLTLGRWFGETIKVSAGFELESKTFSNKNETESFYYFAPDLTLKYDTRDIYWNPGKGILISHYFYKMIGIDPSEYSLLIWRQSYSWFKKINQSSKKLVLALNTTFYGKWGDKQNVWLNYFGDSFTVRGWALPTRDLFRSGEESFRFGYEYVHGTIELRKDIIPKYATDYGVEFGLNLVGFVDAGVVADDWNILKDQILMSGTGFGIRIPMPIVNVFRLDVGWGYRDGKFNSPSIHYGFEQKF